MSEIKENAESKTNGCPSETTTTITGAAAPADGDEDTMGDEGYATLEKPLSNGAACAADEEEKRDHLTPAPSTGRKKSLTLSTMDTDDRRSDEPTKLSFEKGRSPLNTLPLHWTNRIIELQSPKTKKRRPSDN